MGISDFSCPMKSTQARQGDFPNISFFLAVKHSTTPIDKICQPLPSFLVLFGR